MEPAFLVKASADEPTSARALGQDEKEAPPSDKPARPAAESAPEQEDIEPAAESDAGLDPDEPAAQPERSQGRGRRLLLAGLILLVAGAIIAGLVWHGTKLGQRTSRSHTTPAASAAASADPVGSASAAAQPAAR
jgi:hypothetical protein